MTKHYQVTDGNLVLDLWPAEEGGYTVTCPHDPALITEADTLEEAFLMAYDAQEGLREARAKLASASGQATPAGDSSKS
jgi:predicted RNase H-like HicB family nuclease